MSTNQPEPVEGGVFALKSFLLGKLRAHRPLTRRMEYAANIPDGEGASHIVLAPDHEGLRENEDPPDVVVAIDYVSGSSTHMNFRERRNHNPQLIIEFRDRALSGLGTAWADNISDAAKDTTTETSKGWYNPYVSGGSDLQWRSGKDRWVTTVSLRLTWRG